MTDMLKRLDFGRLTRWTSAPLRLFLGLAFIAHGAEKVFGAFGGPGMAGMTHFLRSLGFPAPELFAWLAALLELVGGVLLVAGLATRAVAALLGLEMIVAAFTVHLPHGFFAQNGGMELPLAYLAGLVALVIAGAGALSVDEDVLAKGRLRLRLFSGTRLSSAHP
jgi:putative oxidoreductase